jgi:hypothetical protein
VVTEKYSGKDEHWQGHVVNQAFAALRIFCSGWNENGNSGKSSVSTHKN